MKITKKVLLAAYDAHASAITEYQSAADLTERREAMVRVRNSGKVLAGLADGEPRSTVPGWLIDSSSDLLIRSMGLISAALISGEEEMPLGYMQGRQSGPMGGPGV